jgi:hypothetical protein
LLALETDIHAICFALVCCILDGYGFPKVLCTVF